MTFSNTVTSNSTAGTSFTERLLRWLQTVDHYSQEQIESAQRNSSLTFDFARQLLENRFEITLELSKENTSLMLSNEVSDIQTLALLYEQTLHMKAAKKQGAFYTPAALVDQVLNEATTLCPLDSAKTILDPACGSGVFIIAAIQRMSDASLAKAPELIRAVDLDESALSIARLLTAGALFERNSGETIHTHWKNLEQCFVHGNFLVNESDSSEITDDARAKLSPLPSHYSLKSPAIIIGNPPYGLSRDQQLSKTENDFLLDKYSWARNGKVNKYLLFMAECYSQMKSGDVLSFVVPNAWLGIRGAKRLRELLLESNSLASVSSFKERPFGNASIEVVSFTVKKESAKGDIAIKIFEKAADSTPSHHSSVSSATCLSLLESRVPLCWIPAAPTILEAITHNSIRLQDSESPFRPAIALQAYARGKGCPPQTTDTVKKHVFHHDTAINDTCIPYLEGRDVRRYQIQWSGRFLSYGPWLAEPQILDRFTCPRIIVREVTGTHPTLLLATYTDEPFLYNKSCLHILPSSDNVPSNALLALLGIVNSPLASFFIKLTGNKSQRLLFPKIVNADLLSLPIPVDFLSNCEGLARLVAERLQQPQSPDDLEEDITTAVFDLYELPEKHRKHIRENRFPY